MGPRAAVVLLCVVTLGTLGAITGFGVFDLRAMREGFAQYHRSARSADTLHDAENSLRQCRSALQAFLITRDDGKKVEAYAAAEKVRKLLEAALPFAGGKTTADLERLAVTSGDTGKAIREIIRALSVVESIHADAVEPYLDNALQAVREGLLENRDTPPVVSLCLDMWEGLAKAGAGLREYVASQREEVAGRVSKDLLQVGKTAEQYARRTPGQDNAHRALRSSLKNLDKAFASLRDAVHVTQLQIAKTDALLKGQVLVARELFSVEDGEARAISARHLERFDTAFWVLLSVGGGGLFLGAMLGVAVVIVLSRRERQAKAMQPKEMPTAARPSAVKR